MKVVGQIQMRFAGSRIGRVLLHLLCLCRDGRLRWHARGVARELSLFRNVRPVWEGWRVLAELSVCAKARLNLRKETANS